MPAMTNKHYLYGGVCLVMLSMTAIADSEEDIARCSLLASVGDRIRCLENALREQSGLDAAESVVDSVDSPVAAMDELGDSEDAVTAMEENVRSRASAPLNAPAEVVSEVAVASSAVITEPSVQDDGIGAEQVRARTATQEERQAKLESATNQLVAEYTMVPYERLVVRLENGQVWRQIKGDIQRIRVSLERNQTVDITEPRFGGYQLRLNEIRRTIRVERIK